MPMFRCAAFNQEYIIEADSKEQARGKLRDIPAVVKIVEEEGEEEGEVSDLTAVLHWFRIDGPLQEPVPGVFAIPGR